MERAIDYNSRLTLSPTEAAQMLGISRGKFYSIMRQEGFPAFKCGTRTLISVDGLRRWIENQIGEARA